MKIHRNFDSMLPVAMHDVVMQGDVRFVGGSWRSHVMHNPTKAMLLEAAAKCLAEHGNDCGDFLHSYEVAHVNRKGVQSVALFFVPTATFS